LSPCSLPEAAAGHGVGGAPDPAPSVSSLSSRGDDGASSTARSAARRRRRSPPPLSPSPPAEISEPHGATSLPKLARSVPCFLLRARVRCGGAGISKARWLLLPRALRRQAPGQVKLHGPLRRRRHLLSASSASSLFSSLGAEQQRRGKVGPPRGRSARLEHAVFGKAGRERGVPWPLTIGWCGRKNAKRYTPSVHCVASP
jgi:hypothetical protein